MDEKRLEDAVVALLKRSVVELPPDIIKGLEDAYSSETNEVARVQLKTILDNIGLAKEMQRPICQDTGIHLFFVKIPYGTDVDLDGIIVNAIGRATESVPLRPNAVDPITRNNPGNNIGPHMPYVTYQFHDKEYIEIIAFPKGAGSENMSAMAMLTPAQGIIGIKEFVLNAVTEAGGKPCPPTIIGVGIGGSADLCAKMAKLALLRPLDDHNPDPDLDSLERELAEALNKTGIGPMGLGGRTTVLGVKIGKAACHTASHPVAINIQCWAARKATLRAYPDGRIDQV